MGEGTRHLARSDAVGLAEAGLAWALTDPALDSAEGPRSRARILGCLSD